MSDPAKTIDQNILPVQALFNLDNTFNTFIGQGQPFYATLNPVQSGLTITNSTINSTTIGATTPSTGVFTNISTTTGQISTTPSSNTDIANKFYVDTVAQGLGPKAACQVATTGNITLSGIQTIDGYTISVGDRVLVKNQSTSANNGIYIASSGAWSRSTDMDVWSEVPGAYTVILNGSANIDTGWVCTASTTGTIGTTPMPWVQFANVNTYTAGTGLTLASNQFSITNTGVSAGSYGSASQTLTANVNAQGQLTSLSASSIAISNSQVSGLGTLSTQNANSVAITGGSINGTTIGASSPSTGVFTTLGGTTITASTQFSGPGTGLTGTATTLNIGGNAATATFATSAGSATTATTATNLAGGASNYLPYQSASNTTTFLAPSAGVLQSNSGLAWTTTPALTGTNFSGIPNGALLNSSITIGSTSISLGSTASTLTSVTMATPTISSYETYTATSAPSYNAGRLWYDSTQNALAYYNDVTNNTLHIGEEIQLKVYNNTGSTINVGQPVYVTSTSSGYTYPNVALAIASSLTTGNVIGLANQAIPTGTAGYVTTIGLVQGVNTGSYTVGDTLYLSPYSAGYYQNTIPPTGYAIKLGTVAYVNSSNGAIYVNKSILTVQAGNIVGQVPLANGGTSANLTAVSGGVVYSGASALAISAAGTTGQFLQSNGSSAPTWATPTSYATVTDDTTTNATRYPLFANQTSGNLTTEYTSSTKYQYNPSTGTLSATIFSGSGASLTSIPNSALTNSSITVGSTAISLGGSATTIAGLTSVTSTTFVGALTGNASSATTATTATTATNATNIAITDNTSSLSTYYPVLSVATSGNNPATTSSTKISFVPNTGVLTATSFSGALSGNATSATNIAGGANLQIPYNTASGTTSFIAAPTLPTTYLQYNGTGFVWATASATTGLVVGTTTITGGTSGRIFYDNAGTLGELATTGSGSVVLATSPTLVTPALGTPSSGTLTNCTGLPATTGITGTLPVANGGTGQTSYTNGQLLIGNTTGNTLAKATLTAGTGILVTNGTGSITIANSAPSISWQAVQATNFSATAGMGYPVNTTSGAITVTLPASPTAGDAITLTDYASKWAINNVTIALNGNKFNGVTINAILSTNRQSISLVYIDATQGWIAYSGFLDSIPVQSYTASYLVVAGGGSGGSEISTGAAGGGGGAGGLLTGTANLTTGQVYTIIVGAGAASGASGRNNGLQGSNSTITGSNFTTLTSIGGGYGSCSNQTGGAGGSGGGAGSETNQSGGAGTSGQGNNGGAGTTSSQAGNGGGAGGAGGSTSSSATNAGAGSSSSITGSSVTYAGGGGGGADGSNVAGTGGTGGGGNGGGSNANGFAGTANTGGGGGGKGQGASSGIGGSGGSGVVILSVPTANYSSTTTGSPTVTTSGSNTIIKFTASGSYTA